jgi:adenylate cyclase
LGYEYLGEQPVKNIPKPVGAYRVLMKPDAVGKVIGEKRFLGRISRRTAMAAIIVLVMVAGGLITWNIYLYQSKRIEPASVEKMAFPLPESPSILVLPLKTINSEQNHGYLADGITENIIINLSKIPSIFVIAPRSSFAYKDKSITFKQVAEELGIRYILDGGIQRSENHIRVNAQLIDALTGVTKWAERYDRELKEVFELQDDITQKVVTALEVTLAEGEQARYRRGQTKNSKAYEYYIKGLEHYRRFTPHDNNEALRLFEKAVALDSEYYHAMADIGWAELNNWRFRWGDNPDKSLLRAEDTSTAILKVDPEHSTANSLRGTIYRYKGKFDRAIKYGRKALETEPNGSDITATLATTLMYAGQAQESFELIERAIRLSPKYPSWYLYTLGAAHRQLGNYDKAVAAHEMWQKRNNRSPNPYLALVYTYTLAGRQDDAERAASEFLKKRPMFSVQQWSKSAGYADPHEVSKIERAMLAAGLPE